ncbi:hypothetical protein O1L60_35240 [Streptomyces diastatochromogenes]|nr:hypothetical protein [Streptomyces diastatochromogenes]
MTPHCPLGILDANTLEELARVICGDEHLYYRKGYEIARFLEHAGWQRVPEYDGEYRREWAFARLTERREDPTELENVLHRLADPREYLDEPEQLPAVISAVNAFLIHEGVRLENPGGRPRLVACDPSRPSGQPGPSRTQSHHDRPHHGPEHGRPPPAPPGRGPHLLRQRRPCGRHRHARQPPRRRPRPRRSRARRLLLGRTSPDRVSLDSLIKTCHDAGWIGADVERFCHELRKYRNFVHPRAEIREAHAPDRDTLDMCWPVVNAVLNDLADSQPKAA